MRMAPGINVMGIDPHTCVSEINIAGYRQIDRRRCLCVDPLSYTIFFLDWTSYDRLFSRFSRVIESGWPWQKNNLVCERI